MVHYIEHVSEPWFTLISLGLKKVEGRLNKGRFAEYKNGDIIKWINNDFGKPRYCLTQITKISNYSSFKEYLTKEKIQECLPGIPNLSFGLDVYYKYYTKENEKKFGVLALTMKRV